MRFDENGRSEAAGPESVGSVAQAPGFTYFEALRPGGKRPQPFYLDQAHRLHGATHADGAQAAENELTTAHLNAFPAVQQVQLPPLEPQNPRQVREVQRHAALAGIKPWRNREKRAAEEAAENAAQRVIALELESRRGDHDRLQAEHNAAWDRLTRNDPAVVLPTIEDAFAYDNLPAVAVNLEATELTLALLFAPEDEAVPERKPNVTSTGRRTLKKRSKSEVNEFYALVIASQVLASVREALVFAPGVQTVRAVACREDPSGLSCIYVGLFDGDDVGARGAHRQRSFGLFDDSVLATNNHNRTSELRAIDSDDRDLDELVAGLEAGLRTSTPVMS